MFCKPVISTILVTLMFEFATPWPGTTVSEGRGLNATCDALKTDLHDYDIFSLPGEFYTVTTPLPVDLRTEIKRTIPAMKGLYTALPNSAVDKITMIGYWDNPQAKPNVTLVFGDADDGVSFYLYVRDGRVQVPVGTYANDPAAKSYDLPQDFVISLEFGIDGVKIEIADIYDEDFPQMKLESTCVPYRAIPAPGISHMAIFTDCALIEFEMINILFYNSDTQTVKTEKFSYSGQVYPLLLRGVSDIFFTIYPRVEAKNVYLLGQQECKESVYTALCQTYDQSLEVYGIRAKMDNFDFCFDLYYCFITYKVDIETVV